MRSLTQDIRRVLAVLAAIGTLAMLSSGAWSAAPTPLLGERHKTAGLGCDGCHQETPPKAAPAPAACLACHQGSYGKLAEKTQAVTPHNPHQSHEGELECTECHHVHKPSVDYCGKCHQFGFQVP